MIVPVRDLIKIGLIRFIFVSTKLRTRMWANAQPAVVALPNIGGALCAICSTPQSLADAHY